MKTPEQIAEEAARTVLRDNGLKNPAREDPLAVLGFEMGEGIEYEEALKQFALAAIEADRAHRQEPVHPDWQDDADMYRDAASVDIRWRGWTESGAQIGYSDAGISGAQAAAMFEAIGRLEA